MAFTAAQSRALVDTLYQPMIKVFDKIMQQVHERTSKGGDFGEYDCEVRDCINLYKLVKKFDNLQHDAQEIANEIDSCYQAIMWQDCNETVYGDAPSDSITNELRTFLPRARNTFIAIVAINALTELSINQQRMYAILDSEIERVKSPVLKVLLSRVCLDEASIDSSILLLNDIIKQFGEDKVLVKKLSTVLKWLEDYRKGANSKAKMPVALPCFI